MTRAPSPVRTLLMLTRGGAGGGGRGLLRATVAGSTADGLAEAEPGGGDAGRGAATAVHPASAQHPASALAASVCLAIPTDIPASRLTALGYVKMKPPARRLSRSDHDPGLLGPRPEAPERQNRRCLRRRLRPAGYAASPPAALGALHMK